MVVVAVVVVVPVVPAVTWSVVVRVIMAWTLVQTVVQRGAAIIDAGPVWTVWPVRAIGAVAD
jgi:hypothetical protein